jgi:hypothetical protein
MAATSQPYVLAAIISAIPATLAASSAWYSAHRGRKENHTDNQGLADQFNGVNIQFGTVAEHIARMDTKFEKIELGFQRMDIRFDGIEDKVERHLGWHRAEAEGDLTQALTKESKNDHPTNQHSITSRD